MGTKLSAQPSLAGANIDPDADFLPIDDVSVTTSKKITPTDLVTALKATQAQQEAASILTRIITPGTQHMHPTAVKGWAHYGPSGNIFASYNVSSIDDNGIGDSNVNWTTDFSSANYVVLATLRSDSGVRFPNTFASNVGSSTIESRDTSFANADPLEYYVAAMGDE